MKTITLAGIPYAVHSPSLYVFNHPEGEICIGCNGRAWQIAVNGSYGDREWPSRDVAAGLVAQSIDTAARNLGA